MECVYCKGTLTTQRFPYAANWQGCYLIISDVPSWVCDQCGEPLFDDETEDAIQAMLREMDCHVEQLAVLSSDC